MPKLTPKQVHDILATHDDIPGSYGSYHVTGNSLVVEFNGATRSFPLPKPAKPVKPAKPPPDNLTAIPGVGKTTAQALTKAGFDTRAKLRTAPDEAILDIVPNRTLQAIRAHFQKERHPQ